MSDADICTILENAIRFRELGCRGLSRITLENVEECENIIGIIEIMLSHIRKNVPADHLPLFLSDTFYQVINSLHPSIKSQLRPVSYLSFNSFLESLREWRKIIRTEQKPVEPVNRNNLEFSPASDTPEIIEINSELNERSHDINISMEETSDSGTDFAAFYSNSNSTSECFEYNPVCVSISNFSPDCTLSVNSDNSKVVVDPNSCPKSSVLKLHSDIVLNSVCSDNFPRTKSVSTQTLEYIPTNISSSERVHVQTFKLNRSKSVPCVNSSSVQYYNPVFARHVKFDSSDPVTRLKSDTLKSPDPVSVQNIKSERSDPVARSEAVSVKSVSVKSVHTSVSSSASGPNSAQISIQNSVIVPNSIPSSVPISVSSSVPISVSSSVPISVPIFVPSSVPYSVSSFVPCSVSSSVPISVPSSEIPFSAPKFRSSEIPFSVPKFRSSEIPFSVPKFQSSKIPYSIPKFRNSVPKFRSSEIPYSVPNFVSVQSSENLLYTFFPRLKSNVSASDNCNDKIRRKDYCQVSSSSDFLNLDSKKTLDSWSHLHLVNRKNCKTNDTYFHRFGSSAKLERKNFSRNSATNQSFRYRCSSNIRKHTENSERHLHFQPFDLLRNEKLNYKFGKNPKYDYKQRKSPLSHSYSSDLFPQNKYGFSHFCNQKSKVKCTSDITKDCFEIDATETSCGGLKSIDSDTLRKELLCEVIKAPAGTISACKNPSEIFDVTLEASETMVLQPKCHFYTQVKNLASPVNYLSKFINFLPQVPKYMNSNFLMIYSKTFRSAKTQILFYCNYYPMVLKIPNYLLIFYKISRFCL